MGKKRSWFSLVKRLFIPEGKSKEEKKSKRWRWVFGRLKVKQYPAISVPEKTLSEATAEQRKHAVAVAIATAAAAEAAVTAAHAAAEVVRLTTVPNGFEKINRHLAAIKIQASFRAYLSRKALRALKGVVRLQAVVRGQIVRRTLITHLKSLQSIAKATSQTQQIRVPRIDESCIYAEEKQFFSPKKLLEDKNSKLACKINKNWDYSLYSKEDTEVSCLQRQEATARRDRMKKYSFSHREGRNHVILAESTNKENGRRPWFEECQDVGACTMRETDKLKLAIRANLMDTASLGKKQVELRKNGHKEEQVEISNSSISLPRRSFCRANKQDYSIANDISLPSSPVFPTYMAVTESAKAKIRSASTPRQRLGLVDFCAVHSSLYKPKLSSWSSFDGELAGSNGRIVTFRQKSVRN